MLAVNVIEPALIEWAAPIVLAPKNQGSFQLGIENYRLNIVAMQYCYPVPKISKLIDYFSNQTIFPTLDADNAFW